MALWRPHDVAGTAPQDGYTRVSGVVHVHTIFSDGGGGIDDVVAAAKRAGLHFVVVTDHNTTDAKPLEGYRDGVLVIVGAEVSTTAGHLLGIGIADPTYRFSGDAQDGLDDVRELGGFAFAAHPLSAREDFLWRGWTLPGGWGMEILNGDSQWRAAGWPRLLRAAASYPMNAPCALAGSWTNPAEALAKWDEVTAVRDTPAIVGADAHQRIAYGKRVSLPLPSYESTFRVARNHVLLDRPLTGSAPEDARAIAEALGRGRSYVGLDAIAPAGGVSFVAESGDDRWTMGDTVSPRPDLRLTVGGQIPRNARIAIVANDAGVARVRAESREGTATLAGAGPGLYRAEIRLDGWDAPWVVTNVIAVLDDTAAARRRALSAPAAELPAPAAVEPLDAFDGGASYFSPACDKASPLRSPALDPAGGADGSGAGLLHFALAQPTDAHPDVFCALVDARERDLSGRAGLVFSIRGDAPRRIWLQVRDANPASADEGTEWWFTSVKATPQWRRVAIPFAKLRSINPKSDGKLDLDKVRALVFVVDKGAVRPATEGRIWIDQVGIY